MRIKFLNHGFSLIELMVVIAIVGILATIAAPSYRNYVVRSQVAKGISQAAAWQRTVEDYYNSNGGFPPGGGCGQNAPSSLASTAFDNGTLVWNNCWGTYIYFQFNANAGSELNGKVVYFAPTVDATGFINWACATGLPHMGGGQISCAYMPSSCSSSCV